MERKNQQIEIDALGQALALAAAAAEGAPCGALMEELVGDRES